MTNEAGSKDLIVQDPDSAENAGTYYLTITRNGQEWTALITVLDRSEISPDRVIFSNEDGEVPISITSLKDGKGDSLLDALDGDAGTKFSYTLTDGINYVDVTNSAGSKNLVIASPAQAEDTGSYTLTILYEDGDAWTEWTIDVTVTDGTLSSGAEILSFSLPGQVGEATINTTGGAITIEVPFGTDLTDLVATFTTSEGIQSIKVGETGQESGTTANDFSETVTYVVTAQDGTTKEWTVTVNLAADQSGFDLSPSTGTPTENIGFTLNITGAKGTGGTTITGETTVTVTSDNGEEDLSGLTSVTMDGDGNGVINITLTQAGEQEITVTLGGVTESQKAGVTVQATQSSAAEILTFSLPGQVGEATINTTGGAITIEVPFGTDLTDLVATFTTSEGIQSIKVGETGQESGTTANDFSSTVTYVVTAQDGTTKEWTVTVSIIDAPVLTVNDQVTNNSTPTITGISSEIGGTVTITVNGKEYTGTVGPEGTWSVEITDALADGTYTVEATVEDGLGNIANETGQLIIDTTAPQLTVNDQAANSSTPTITGTSDELGGTVTLTVNGKEYTTTVGPEGTWNVEITDALADGTYTVGAEITDAAGNTAQATGNLVINTQATGLTVNDQMTNDTTPVISGTADLPAGSQVEVTVTDAENDVVFEGEAEVGAGGNWSIEITEELGEGTYTVEATIEDGLGNIANETGQLTIDTTAPQLTVNDQAANSSTPTITGTSDELGGTVTLTVNGKEYTGTVGLDGTWSVEITDALADGTYTVGAEITDAAGNTAQATGNLVINTQAPGLTVNDQTTNDTTPGISGTADLPAGSQVEVTVTDAENDVVFEGEAEVGAGGNWTVTIPEEKALEQGSYNVTVKITDEHGNIVTATGTITVIDSEEPHIDEELDGWVSNFLWRHWNKDQYRETWKEETYYPGSPIKLSSITSSDITSVIAEIYSITTEGEIDEKIIQLALSEVPEELISPEGYKLWQNVTWSLPDNFQVGRYFVTFHSIKEGRVVENDNQQTSNPVAPGYNNYFTVSHTVDLAGTVYAQDSGEPVVGAVVRLLDLGQNPLLHPDTKEEFLFITGEDGKYHFSEVEIKQYILQVISSQYREYRQNIFIRPGPGEKEVIIDAHLINFTIGLVANPSTILGDGKSTSVLTTTILDREGEPLAGVNVTMTAPLGNFMGNPHDPAPGGNTGTTDENGKVDILFLSEKIEGVISQAIPVIVIVEDPERNLYAKDQIIITFEPGAIKGTVRDNKTGMPVEGARVIVSKDFNGDGVIDFYAEFVTGPDGRYQIAIPKGDVQYEVEIIIPVIINGQEVPISYKQVASPGVILGGGGEEDLFPSEKTFSGVIICKGEDNSERIMGLGSTETITIRQITPGGEVDPDGKSGAVNQDTGVFSIGGLEVGVTYEFVVIKEVPGNPPVVMGKVEVTLNEEGEINIHQMLVDPYGTITDSVTGKIIAGVHVELFYADTARNQAEYIIKGDTGQYSNKPHKSVNLPELHDPPFPPSNNINPQWSATTAMWSDLTGDYGNYAWMVFPTSDYYIVATKEGYHTYTSPVISVEYDIVKHDFSMIPIAIDPVDPADPVDPVDPVDPIEGPGPSRPSRPSRPTEPETSEEAEDLEEPVEPGEVEDTLGPSPPPPPPQHLDQRNSSDPNKEWTIEFSKPVDESTLNQDNIYVTVTRQDEEEEKVPVRLVITDKGYRVVVIPEIPYDYDLPYTLYINQDLESEENERLPASIVMEFIIYRDQEEDQQEILEIAEKTIKEISEEYIKGNNILGEDPGSGQKIVIIVLEEASDEEGSQDLVLPIEGKYGITITWSAEPQGWINTDPTVGKIGTILKRPDCSEGDITVILTVTVTLGDIVISRDFLIIIKCQPGTRPCRLCNHEHDWKR